MTTALELRNALAECKHAQSQLVSMRSQFDPANNDPTAIAALSGAFNAYKQTREKLKEVRRACMGAPRVHAASEKGSVVADGKPGRPKDPQAETPVEAVRPSQYETQPDPKAPARSSQRAMSTNRTGMTLLTTSPSASILADVLRGRWDGPANSST